MTKGIQTFKDMNIALHPAEYTIDRLYIESMESVLAIRLAFRILRVRSGKSEGPPQEFHVSVTHETARQLSEDLREAVDELRRLAALGDH